MPRSLTHCLHEGSIRGPSCSNCGLEGACRQFDDKILKTKAQILLAMGNESRKEAFRKYLEASGVLDSLTKALMALYEEPGKPEKAVEYIRLALGSPSAEEYEVIKAQNEELAAQLDALQAQHLAACRKIEELEKAKAE